MASMVVGEVPAPADVRRAGRPVAARGHHVLLAGTLACLALGLVLDLGSGSERLVNPFLPVIVAGALLDSVLGYLISRRHTGHAVGRILALTGMGGALTVLAGGHANAALFGALPDLGATGSLWVSRWLWVPVLVLGTIALMLVFPDGRLPSRRWRPAAGAALAGGAAFTLLAMTTPFADSVWGPVPVTNPFATVPDAVLSVAWPVASLWLVAGAAVGSAAVVARFRRSRGSERARLSLVVLPAVLVPPALLAGQFAGEAGGVAEMLVGVWLAVAVTVSMLRHGILDLDVVVNRAVVCTLLAASLVGVYVGVVALAAQAIGSRSSWLPGVVGAGVVAVTFSPLLHALREGLARFLYGDRAQPDLVVGRIADGGRTDDVLPSSAHALRTALRAPWVRIRAGDTEVTSGEVRTTGHEVPLRHGDEVVGSVTVGARYDGERQHADDIRVLDAVARQLGGTAHALLLARSLATARERLVAAREDERRRIRRDLHDGLGPTLAGITLALEGAEELAERAPDAALALLTDVRVQSEGAVADVRRLVDGLRPVALDTLGLAGALRQEMNRLTVGGPAVELRAPSELPDLPAATEVAALRIALEALHNVRRHARARRCTVELDARPDRLLVRVADDGMGIPAGTLPHVGLSSMRERAEEVGGSLAIASNAGGTEVSAVLPLVTP